MVLPRAGHVLDEVTGGLPTVGLRVPAHPVAHELLAAFGGGLAAPSANPFGTVSPTSAAHVRAAFGAALASLADGSDLTFADRVLRDRARFLAERGVDRSVSADEPLGAEGLGLDSVGRLDLLSRIEKECGVRVPERYWGSKPLRSLAHLADVAK